ncbi:hypothetical protein [Methylocaldum szegediense]|jgi:hypothetical protein|nr:hypothetical protein [Methylocaldum szegediense]
MSMPATILSMGFRGGCHDAYGHYCFLPLYSFFGDQRALDAVNAVNRIV